MGLSVSELVRIWRVVRELDSEDVLTLYGFWLIPHKLLQRPTNRPGDPALAPKVLFEWSWRSPAT